MTVTITCPWCEEDDAMLFADFADPETASMCCAACGTSVALVEEPDKLNLAA
jgi:hypothetical protein